MSTVPEAIPLSQAHWDELSSESGLGAGIIKARGYETVTREILIRDNGYSDQQLPKTGEFLRVPHYDVSGDVTHYQIKPDNPREDERGKARKYELPAGTLSRLDIPNVEIVRSAMKSKDAPLYITEGSKKADAGAQAGLCMLSVTGVYGWRGRNDLGGTTTLADWEDIHLKDRTVYIVFDNDVMTKPQVRDALIRLARWLRGRKKAKVHAIVLRIDGFDGKLGLDDYLARGKASDLLSCVDDSVFDADDSIVTNDRSGVDIHQEALKAMVDANVPPSVFIRNATLVRVREDELGTPGVQELGIGGLRNHLTKVAKWTKVTSTAKGQSVNELTHAPKDIVEHFLAEGEWPGIPPLVGIASHPILSPDGTISGNRGYCESSRYFLAGSEPEKWRGTVEEARDFLLFDVLQDFRFKDRASQAHALALALLPIVRPIISEATPLHVIQGPIQDSGKSKLAQALLYFTQGNIESQTMPSSEEEWVKVIVSQLKASRSYVWIDDVNGYQKSDALNNVLTSPRFTGRLLSTNEMYRGPNNAAWLMTANNVRLSPDLAKRSLHIYLDTGLADPSKRTDIVHTDLTWIRRENAKIMGAAIAMIEHGVRSGFPYSGRLHGKYPIWSNVLGGILESCGVLGFMENADERAGAADSYSVAETDFVKQWWETYRDTETFSRDLMELWQTDDELVAKISRGKCPKTEFGKSLGALTTKTYLVIDPDSGEEIAVSVSRGGKTGGAQRWILRKTRPTTPLTSLESCTTSLSIQVQKVGEVGEVGDFLFSRIHAQAHKRARGNEVGKTTSNTYLTSLSGSKAEVGASDSAQSTHLATPLTVADPGETII